VPVPASRSRTERWRDCLQQIADRGGALEITLDQHVADGPPIGSLIWRVPVVGIGEDEILVERPLTLGKSIDLDDGARLIVAMTIGQNRWMFKTHTLPRAGGRPCVRLKMPSQVERCQRRNFYRISTTEITLPRVECWPLLEPASVAAAEIACRTQIEESLRTGMPVKGDSLMPEVGPRFRASLVNIGGGGAGLVLEPGDASAVDRTRLFWTRMDLRPHIPAPLAVTARLAHTHVDSAQNVYAGMAFEFGFNPSHKEFVVEQIVRYARVVQKAQTLMQVDRAA
jgi:hypothetical protein